MDGIGKEGTVWAIYEHFLEVNVIDCWIGLFIHIKPAGHAYELWFIKNCGSMATAPRKYSLQYHSILSHVWNMAYGILYWNESYNLLDCGNHAKFLIVNCSMRCLMCSLMTKVADHSSLFHVASYNTALDISGVLTRIWYSGIAFIGLLRASATLHRKQKKTAAVYTSLSVSDTST